MMYDTIDSTYIDIAGKLPRHTQEPIVENDFKNPSFYLDMSKFTLGTIHDDVVLHTKWLNLINKEEILSFLQKRTHLSRSIDKIIEIYEQKSELFNFNPTQKTVGLNTYCI